MGAFEGDYRNMNIKLHGYGYGIRSLKSYLEIEILYNPAKRVNNQNLHIGRGIVNQAKRKHEDLNLGLGPSLALNAKWSSLFCEER